MSAVQSQSGEDGSSSPESDSAVFMVSNGGGGGFVLRDHDDHADLFIEDDSSSPSPESDKLAFSGRRPPSKFAQAASRRISAAAHAKSGRPGGKTPGASTPLKGFRTPAPLPTPAVPRRAEDWEPWKGVLHELYITQNRILRDIIVIMDTNYNLRAT